MQRSSGGAGLSHVLREPVVHACRVTLGVHDFGIGNAARDPLAAFTAGCGGGWRGGGNRLIRLTCVDPHAPRTSSRASKHPRRVIEPRRRGHQRVLSAYCQVSVFFVSAPRSQRVDARSSVHPRTAPPPNTAWRRIGSRKRPYNMRDSAGALTASRASRCASGMCRSMADTLSSS